MSRRSRSELTQQARRAGVEGAGAGDDQLQQGEGAAAALGPGANSDAPMRGYGGIKDGRVFEGVEPDPGSANRSSDVDPAGDDRLQQ